MKKFLALFLIMAMLVSSLAIFSSCKDSVSKAEVSDDPYTTLMKASRNTITDFFIVDDKAKDIIKDASKKGAYTVKLSDIDGYDDLEDMTATLYADAEKKNFVVDYAMTLDDEDYNYRIFANPDALVATIDQIDRTLKVDLNKFTKEFEDSDLFEMANLDDKAVKEYVEAFMELFEDIKAKLDESYAKSVENANEYISIFVSEVVEGKITIDGEKVTCIKMPLTFNTKNVKKFINKIYAEADALEDLDEFEDSKDDLIERVEYLLEDKELNLDLYINKDTTSFAKIVVKADLGEDAPAIKGEIFFSESKIVFKGSVKTETTENALTAEITKTTSDTKTTFKFSAEVTHESGSTEAKIKIAEGSFVYNKDSGSVKATIEIPGDLVGTDMEISFKGNFKTDGKKVIFTANEVSIEDADGNYSESYDFKLQLIVDSGAKAPSAPKNATNIMELDEDEWMELVEDLNDMM